MIRFKTSLNYVIFVSALLVLALVIGCGSSAEKQAMSDFLKLFNDTVSEYSAADENRRAEIKGKLDSFTSKWSDMKMEMDGKITPNALDELDKEYQKIAKKYASLAGKS